MLTRFLPDSQSLFFYVCFCTSILREKESLVQKYQLFLFTFGHFRFHFQNRKKKHRSYVSFVCAQRKRKENDEKKKGFKSLNRAHLPSIIDTSLFACLTMCKTSSDYIQSIPSRISWRLIVSSFVSARPNLRFFRARFITMYFNYIRQNLSETNRNATKNLK